MSPGRMTINVLFAVLATAAPGAAQKIVTPDGRTKRVEDYADDFLVTLERMAFSD